MKGENWEAEPDFTFPFSSSVLLDIFTMDYFYLIEEIIWLQLPGPLGNSSAKDSCPRPLRAPLSSLLEALDTLHIPSFIFYLLIPE